MSKMQVTEEKVNWFLGECDSQIKSQPKQKKKKKAFKKNLAKFCLITNFAT